MSIDMMGLIGICIGIAGMTLWLIGWKRKPEKKGKA